MEHRTINFNQLLKQSDISIVFVGSAGQGLQTLNALVTNILKRKGYFVFSTQELMSRIRGGTNSVEIRFSQQKCFAFVRRIDIVIALNQDAISHLKPRITPKTIIISPFEGHVSDYGAFYFPATTLAKKLGNPIYMNSIILGMTCYLFSIEINILKQVFDKYFASLDESKKTNNVLAAKKGYAKGKELWPNAAIDFPTVDDPNTLKEKILINGAEATALGAIAGGCNFVCAYPMSPSTSVLLNVAKRSHQYHIGIEQVEDEISAVNMALGAWYAGGRALVTTSGGGFALMCEGVSLAGMTETPLVIMVGQRPGPATGLPTRTEQGDLNLVHYAGHGEFPRFIFAPGTIEQAFLLMKHAFDVADKFQVPVFFLADQYFLESFYTAKPLHEQPEKITSHIVKTTENYKRYALTENGISPRGIPNYGDGIVCVDSDEHTEKGLITEDFSVRKAMQNKRMRKLLGMRESAIQPTFYGPTSYDCLIICWGSNFYLVQESILRLKHMQTKTKFAMLHFSQVYPLNLKVKKYFERAKKIIAIENNYTHQFATLLEMEFQIKFDAYILQYDGQPFAVETIIEKLQNIALS